MLYQNSDNMYFKVMLRIKYSKILVNDTILYDNVLSL